MRRVLIGALFGLLAACAGQEPEQAPRVGAVPYAADPQPYDPAVDAAANVDAALRTARGENKLVLVNMGNNDSPACRAVSGMMRIEAIAALVERHYAVVKVDIGAPERYEANIGVARRFGLDGVNGLPTLLIVTPSGHLLNGDDPFAFSDEAEPDPQDLADYLHRYAAGPRR